MVDWPGLLKWSLAQTDSTSAFQPMDPDTRHWLHEALESFAFNEKEQLRRITEVLGTMETGSSPQECQLKEDILSELMSIIDNPELANNLVNCGGLSPLVHCMLGSRYVSVRKMASLIFSSAAQNNPSVQSYAHSQGVLEGLMEAVRRESDVQTKESYVTSLSALVRGEFQDARADFVQRNGLELVRGVVLDPVSVRIVKKSLLLTINVFYYDHLQPELHIFEQAQSLGLVPILLSLETHADMEIRQMALQALLNLGRRQIAETQEIRQGIEDWRGRLRRKVGAEEESRAVEEIIQSTGA